MQSLKNQKGISLICLILILAIIVVGIILAVNIIKGNSIENIVLTKDNFQETMTKYSELKRDTDDIVYVGYAMMYHMFGDYLSNAFISGTPNEENAYTNIYGKTINELKEEGKSLMKQNNVTPKEFRENMK